MNGLSHPDKTSPKPPIDRASDVQGSNWRHRASSWILASGFRGWQRGGEGEGCGGQEGQGEAGDGEHGGWKEGREGGLLVGR